MNNKGSLQRGIGELARQDRARAEWHDRQVQRRENAAKRDGISSWGFTGVSGNQKVGKRHV